uniref:Tnp22-3 n=1 Tax=Streptococcus suis TaxID=1307 RepID=A0A0F6UY93_STRSU|nr:Tnp22-3 [Streptococcus suis]AKE80647.1 Tnp22-3 [Streptococcus suis]
MVDRVKECDFHFSETNFHQNIVSAFLLKAARLGNSQWDDGL